MPALTYVTFFVLTLGLAWSSASAIGVTVNKRQGDEPTGERDTALNRYMYTTYGGFSKKSTLYAGLVMLIAGVIGTTALLATGNWTFQN